MPDSATKFTITSGCDQKITWVRQADGAWRATTDTGKDAGVWSVTDFSVSVVEHGTTNKTDLSTGLKVTKLADQKKQVFLGGHAVAISNTNSTVTFSQDKDSILFEPAVIEYWTK